MFTYEEHVWKQRCSEQWILKGDSNSSFFHSVAHGRRRKCNTFSLKTEEAEIAGPSKLRKHIEDYYKQLFGREERDQIKMVSCYLVSCRRILDEARIHKYTHTNNKLSALNLKYYKFSSSFDTIEFCSRK
jgi:hypothetical protein